MADAAMDLFEKMAIERQKTVNAILQLLNQMIKESGMAFYDREAVDSLKAMSEHMEKGGEVRTDMVDSADAAMFEDLLRKYRVPFSSIKASDPKQEGERVVFITKDSDRALMELVRKQYGYVAHMKKKDKDGQAEGDD